MFALRLFSGILYQFDFPRLTISKYDDAARIPCLFFLSWNHASKLITRVTILRSYVDKLSFLFYYERQRISGNYFLLIHFKNMTSGLKNL